MKKLPKIKLLLTNDMKRQFTEKEFQVKKLTQLRN